MELDTKRLCSGVTRLAIGELVGLVRAGANIGVCTVARDGAMASVEVLAGPARRHRWRVEQKQAIVAAAFEPGAVVRDVARQADVTPSLIYRWPRDLRAAANGFAQVLVAPTGDGVTAPPPVPAGMAADRSQIPINHPRERQGLGDFYRRETRTGNSAVVSPR